MAKRLFIHKTTRVIRRATTDDTIQPLPSEDAVEVTFDCDLRKNGKYWKLSPSATYVEEATEQEIEDSNVDADRVALRRQAIKEQINQIVDDMADNGVTFLKLREYFIRIKQLRNDAS